MNPRCCGGGQGRRGIARRAGVGARVRRAGRCVGRRDDPAFQAAMVDGERTRPQLRGARRVTDMRPMRILLLYRWRRRANRRRCRHPSPPFTTFRFVMGGPTHSASPRFHRLRSPCREGRRRKRDPTPPIPCQLLDDAFSPDADKRLRNMPGRSVADRLSNRDPRIVATSRREKSRADRSGPDFQRRAARFPKIPSPTAISIWRFCDERRLSRLCMFVGNECIFQQI
ncbi:hypothetical protein [Burkholderia mayonis]|uniref:hypothetical protein n=1 Tax=Burkholderia mayonis TaxID=1385591 RepID=UPI000AD8FB3A|nr:hypothetical protein [Burkholderia mayonis]